VEVRPLHLSESSESPDSPTSNNAMISKRVVVIGGGTGSFQILSGLREHHPHLALQSVVTTFDSGGDSGELRDAYGVLPPGDLRRCLVALSEESLTLRQMFSYRFDGDGPLEGRNFGNLMILVASKVHGSERVGLAAIAKLLKIRGEVLPVSWDHSTLVADLEDGERLVGEGVIDRRGRELERNTALSPIRSIHLEPPASPNSDALAAIAAADVICLAPGDIFTSILPSLLVVGNAVRQSHAPLVSILNLMSRHGETDGWSGARHIEEISRALGRRPDAVLVSAGPLPQDLLDQYEGEASEPVELDLEESIFDELLVHPADLIATEGVIRHDPERTAKALSELFEKLPARVESVAR